MYDRRSRVASRISLELRGVGLEPDQTRDPVGVLDDPAWVDVAELEDEVFLAQFADLEAIDHRLEAFDPRVDHESGGGDQRARFGEVAGEVEEFVGGRPDRELDHQRDRGEVEDGQLGARRPNDRAIPGQGHPGRVEGQPQGRRSILDRLRGPSTTSDQARLGRDQRPGAVEVDLVADIKSEREVDRRIERFLNWGGTHGRKSQEAGLGQPVWTSPSSFATDSVAPASRVEPRVDLAEPAQLDPGVDLGGRDRDVAEHLLNDPEVGPAGK